MSEANKRGTLPPIIDKQLEIIESLTWLCKYQQNLLSQYMSVEEEEENKLKHILTGDDVIV